MLAHQTTKHATGKLPVARCSLLTKTKTVAPLVRCHLRHRTLNGGVVRFAADACYTPPRRPRGPTPSCCMCSTCPSPIGVPPCSRLVSSHREALAAGGLAALSAAGRPQSALACSLATGHASAWITFGMPHGKIVKPGAEAPGGCKVARG